MKPVSAVLTFARSGPGRLFFTLLGIGAVTALALHVGVNQLTNAISRTGRVLPWVFACEGGIIICDAVALRLLYRQPRPSWREIMRVTLMGAAVTAVVPAGRTVAEGVKAVALAPRVGGARAAFAAARIQAVILLSNAAVSLLPIVSAFAILDARTVGAVVSANAVLMLGLGFGILLGGRGLKVGAFIGRRWKRARQAGPALDAMWRTEPVVPGRVVAVELVARLLTVAQLAVLLATVGAHGLVAHTLLAEGVLLVGASLGDLLPAQLGVTDANFVLSASFLGIGAASALALPLTIRISQLAWAGIGALVPFFWPAEAVGNAVDEAPEVTPEVGRVGDSRAP